MAKKNGKPSRREIELTGFRLAGYHSDSADYTRKLIERRYVGVEAARAASAEGAKMRRNGIPCSCMKCKAGAL